MKINHKSKSIDPSPYKSTHERHVQTLSNAKELTSRVVYDLLQAYKAIGGPAFFISLAQRNPELFLKFLLKFLPDLSPQNERGQPNQLANNLQLVLVDATSQKKIANFPPVSYCEAALPSIPKESKSLSNHEILVYDEALLKMNAMNEKVLANSSSEASFSG
jgi:hypothetical protein